MILVQWPAHYNAYNLCVSTNISACMLPFTLIIYYASWQFSEEKKKLFDVLIPPRGHMMRVRTKFLLVYCRVFHSLKFDMEHDHILKKDFN